MRRTLRHALEGVPELLGIPSPVEPDLLAHWGRVLARSRDLLHSLPSPSGPRVAVFHSLSRKRTWPGRSVILAYALRLRGAKPVLVACDQWLPACEEGSGEAFTAEEWISQGPRRLCGVCFGAARTLFDAVGLPARRLSEFEKPDSRETAAAVVQRTTYEDLFSLRHRGVSIGPALESSLFRFLLCSTRPKPTQEVEAIFRRYALAGVLLVDAVDSMLEEIVPDVVVSHYGVYLSRGIPPRVATARGKRAVTVFHFGYRPGVALIGMGTHFAGELASRSTGPWIRLEMTPARRERLRDWFERRETGTTWDIGRWSPRQPVRDDELAKKLGLDRRHPIVALFTGVGWDSREMTLDPEYLPEEMVFDAIRYAAANPMVQLAVRAHPGEVEQRAVEGWTDAILQRFPSLPPNVRLIPAGDPVRSYDLARLANAVLTYASTLGLEIACRGHPVICVGRPPYRGKGFTFDVQGRDEMVQCMDRAQRLASSVGPDWAEAAQRFAYYMWFMRGLPFPFWYRREERWPGARRWWHEFRSLSDLLPGRHAGLDAICDAILLGREPYLADA